MVLERVINEVTQKGRQSAAPDIGEIRETVYIYDYDPQVKGGVIWQATLPLSELFAHLGASCRYTYEADKIRPFGAGFGAVAGGLVISLLFMALLPVAMAAVLGVMFGCPIGGMVGWVVSPRFAPKPLWMVRRIWTQIPPDDRPAGPPTIGYDGKDTYMDGEWERTAQPLPHYQLMGPPVWPHLMNAMPEPTAQSGHLIGLSDQPDATYKPVVERATTLHRVLQQMVTKRRLTRKDMSGWQKVQIGSCAALAFGVIGLLIFVTLITEEPAAAAHLIGVNYA